MIPPPDPEAARQAAAEVLSDDRFDWVRSNGAIPGWLRRFFEWLGRLLSGGNGRRPPKVNPDGLGLVSTLVIVVVVMLVVAIAWWAILWWGRRTRGADDDDSDVDVELTDEHGLDEFLERTEPEWSAEALAASAAGDGAQAVRAQYGRAVVAAVRAGWGGSNLGRTSGELAADVALAAPAQSANFAALTHLFEDCWFGHIPASESAMSDAGALADAIVTGATAAGLGAGTPRVSEAQR